MPGCHRRPAPAVRYECGILHLIMLMCLSTPGCPHPDQCELYCVNRDTLFSYNKVSEVFLQRLMALYVASHYKVRFRTCLISSTLCNSTIFSLLQNSPNDLQLLSDAPGHRIFCLLGPVDVKAGGLPEILCVIQVRQSCVLIACNHVHIH